MKSNFSTRVGDMSTNVLRLGLRRSVMKHGTWRAKALTDLHIEPTSAKETLPVLESRLSAGRSAMRSATEYCKCAKKELETT